MSDTPVLLLVYRRPDVTAQVLSAIARYRPKRLFVVADGPARPAEEAECGAARDAALAVEWPCEIETNFSPTNMGVRDRFFSALDWFFERVNAGIVLEDDCLPAPDFFRFCSELLHRYSGDRRIVHISGESYAVRPRPRHSYVFSKYPLSWGWATWRRAWTLRDPSMRTWPSFRESAEIEALFDTADERDYWTGVFDQTHAGRIPTTWDYQWYYTCMTEGLSIHPVVNLVTNVGAGTAAAVHMRAANDVLSGRPTQSLESPLIHPEWIVRDKRADMDTFDWRFPGAVLRRQRTLAHQIRRPFRWLSRVSAR